MSKKEIFNPASAPKAIGPYNQVVKVGNLIYTAGQIAIDPATGNVSQGAITEQTRQVIQNLQVLLQSAGSSLDHVIKATVFLKNMNDFSAMNAVYGEFFNPATAPARSTIEVARLPKDALIEIEAVAAV